MKTIFSHQEMQHFQTGADVKSAFDAWAYGKPSKFFGGTGVGIGQGLSNMAQSVEDFGFVQEWSTHTLTQAFSLLAKYNQQELLTKVLEGLRKANVDRKKIMHRTGIAYPRMLEKSLLTCANMAQEDLFLAQLDYAKPHISAVSLAHFQEQLLRESIRQGLLKAVQKIWEWGGDINKGNMLRLACSVYMRDAGNETFNINAPPYPKREKLMNMVEWILERTDPSVHREAGRSIPSDTYGLTEEEEPALMRGLVAFRFDGGKLLHSLIKHGARTTDPSGMTTGAIENWDGQPEALKEAQRFERMLDDQKVLKDAMSDHTSGTETPYKQRKM